MVRPRKYDETEVLQGAVAMFRERGYDGTTIPELTARLGICRQSIYATFGGKRGLYLRALEAWARQEVDSRLELLGAEGPAIENVRTVVRGLAALAASCPDDGSLTVTALVETGRDPDVMALVEGQIARLERGFAAALRTARDQGALPASASPERLARVLTTATYGIGLLTRLPGGSRLIADTVSVLLETLEAPPVSASPQATGNRPSSPSRRFEPGI